MLWYRAAAVAPIKPLAWELPYAAPAAPQKAKKKKKKKKKKRKKKKKKGVIHIIKAGRGNKSSGLRG